MSSWGPDVIAEVFLHDVDPGVARDTERYQGTPGDGMFGEPWPLESWPEVPTHVLAPTEDRLFPLEFQRRVARERLGLEIDEIPGGHLPMLSRPRARRASHRAGTTRTGRREPGLIERIHAFRLAEESPNPSLAQPLPGPGKNLARLADSGARQPLRRAK